MYSIARLSSAFLSLLLLLVLVSGCVQAPLIAGKPSGVAPLSPSVAIAQIGQKAQLWRDFQCKLGIEVQGKSGDFSTNAIVLVKSPNFIRFETFTPIGTTAALYVSNEAGPFLLIPSQKTIFTARRPETLVRRFLGGSLPIDLFSSVLSGSIPPERLKTIRSSNEGGLLRLIEKGPAGYFEWQILSGALARVFIGTSRFEGRVVYDPAVRLATESTPETIRISSKGWSMKIHVEKMQHAERFPPGAFRLPSLTGLRRVDLDAGK
ncbi:MAG: hypothetical protein ACP5SH_07250 [Syntrophobacteraceae bacterium]